MLKVFSFAANCPVLLSHAVLIGCVIFFRYRVLSPQKKFEKIRTFLVILKNLTNLMPKRQLFKLLSPGITSLISDLNYLNLLALLSYFLVLLMMLLITVLCDNNVRKVCGQQNHRIAFPSSSSRPNRAPLSIMGTFQIYLPGVSNYYCCFLIGSWLLQTLVTQMQMNVSLKGQIDLRIELW